MPSSTEALRFEATLEILGVNPYVAVSARRAGRLKANWRRPMPVLVRVNGKPHVPWRINMVPKGTGDFYLYLHETVRRASRTKVGDQVAVEVWFDAAYRNGPMHPMRKWFSGPLRANARAHAAWKALPPSRKKELLRYLANLKSDAARGRNVVRAVRVLSGKPERFMGRQWKNGA